mgnify:CR=1 FL=1
MIRNKIEVEIILTDSGNLRLCSNGASYLIEKFSPLSVGLEVDLLYSLGIMDKMKIKEGDSINALVSKFDNGLELYQNNAVFANCIEHLLRGGDIYKIFEQVFVTQTKTQEKLSELIKSGTLRQEIIVSKEKFDELTSGL